ncbi:chemokine (C motif) receptor 1a, duplicate 1 isoform X2 [Larimichthys crocea]|uniref:chemokine (C motif) receptor 1a, duplicate 1 isoform X2 n=1 Tax=Larimichthys crocea TaxID=215358 RepID=UPI000F5F5021|nr:chemokine XC receptor 1-like isoform X2 [Larimichthys crocea]
MNDSSNESQHDYDTDYEDEVCEKGEVARFTSIVIPIFFSVVIILSIIGNVLVLVILALYENLKSLTNIFILNLAISDLVFTTGLPFWAIYHIWGWLFSETLCKIVSFVFFTGFYSSILFLTIMTVYRYLAVVHPLSGLNTHNINIGIFFSFLLWMISIGAAMPSLLYSSIVSIPLKVMAFCYIRILRRIRKTRSHTKNRAVKLVFCIVAVFFLGWVPYNVLIFLRNLADNVVPPFDKCEISIQIDYAYYVSRLIAFSHCCLNPVFYAFVGVKFRRHLKSMLHQVFNRQNPVEEQQVRLQTFSRGSMY